MIILPNQRFFTEDKIIILIGRVLMTPYNFSLIIMTVLWWHLCYYSPYSSNGNFDMTVTMSNYLIYLNLLVIAVSVNSNGQAQKHLTRLGVVGLMLSILALATIKSFVAHSFGALIITPLSQFCGLLVLKNMWLITLQIVDLPKDSRVQQDK